MPVLHHSSWIRHQRKPTPPRGRCNFLRSRIFDEAFGPIGLRAQFFSQVAARGNQRPLSPVHTARAESNSHGPGLLQLITVVPVYQRGGALTFASDPGHRRPESLWPITERSRRSGPAWTRGLRFGWRRYSDHESLLTSRSWLHCTAPSQFRILQLPIEVGEPPREHTNRSLPLLTVSSSQPSHNGHFA